MTGTSLTPSVTTKDASKLCQMSPEGQGHLVENYRCKCHDGNLAFVPYQPCDFGWLFISLSPSFPIWKTGIRTTVIIYSTCVRYSASAQPCKCFINGSLGVPLTNLGLILQIGFFFWQIKDTLNFWMRTDICGHSTCLISITPWQPGSFKACSLGHGTSAELGENLEQSQMSIIKCFKAQKWGISVNVTQLIKFLQWLL